MTWQVIVFGMITVGLSAPAIAAGCFALHLLHVDERAGLVGRTHLQDFSHDPDHQRSET